MSNSVYEKIRLLKEQYQTYEEYKKELEQLELTVNKLPKDIDQNKVNELNDKINNLKTLISKYNKSDIDVIAKFLSVESQFQETSAYIKEIEQVSKKLNDGKAQMLNAEGRKKYINVTFVNEYAEKVKEKKELLKQLTDISKKAMRIENILVVENNIEEENVDLEENITINENINIDDKLAIVNEKIRKILDQAKLPNQGKKIYVNIEGEKVDFPKKLYGLYQNAKREQKKYLAESKDNNTLDPSQDNIKSTSTVVESNNVNNKFIEVDHLDDSEKIVKLKPGKFSLKRKMKFKFPLAIATAAVALVTSVAIMCNILPKKSLSKKNINTNSEYSVEQIVDSNGLEDHDIAIDSADKPNENDENNISEDDINKIDINTIVLNDNAMIYKDSYSASAKDENEQLTPYYQDKTKEIAGVTFAKDGKLITIYKNDPNFEQKYHELLQNNASIRSYLTSNDNVYEGYFNVDDVKEVKIR